MRAAGQERPESPGVLSHAEHDFRFSRPSEALQGLNSAQDTLGFQSTNVPNGLSLHIADLSPGFGCVLVLEVQVERQSKRDADCARADDDRPEAALTASDLRSGTCQDGDGRDNDVEPGECGNRV